MDCKRWIVLLFLHSFNRWLLCPILPELRPPSKTGRTTALTKRNLADDLEADVLGARVAVDHLFPEGLGDNVDEDSDGNPAAALGTQTWSAVGARKTGYIESIDEDALLKLARKHGIIVRMERGIGEFIVDGIPLMSLAAGPGRPSEKTATELNEVYVISRHRLVHQDAGFGIRQIVDIAMKSLSPGVNDTTDRCDVRGLSRCDPHPAGGAKNCDSLPPGPGRVVCHRPPPRLREPVWPKPSTRSGKTPKATSRS